jgi:hypothetical protein
MTVTVPRASGVALRPDTPLPSSAGRGVGWGATFGGRLVYDYGFNVETAGDHPVWHQSGTDVFPGPARRTRGVMT